MEEIKFQVFAFALPYYFYLMVTVSLLCSALTFYTNVKNLLYPQLKAKENCLNSLMLTKKRYFILQTFIVVNLSINVGIIAGKTKPESA